MRIIPGGPGSFRRGFTMVEIALSLAIIGFALVAIISVLPFGLDVQRENREDTVIGQDATILINAIRNGARGADDLTRYVIGITNVATTYDSATGAVISGPITNAFTSAELTSGARIVGLLSTPKYVLAGDSYTINSVTAAFRAMSGPASARFPQDNADVRELAFGYRVISDVQVYGWGSRLPGNPQANMHEVRLVFRWPWAKGAKATGWQIYRTLVGGSLVQTSEPGFPAPLYFLQPQSYTK
jgi:prepilin-type N-terminal cleavage/methylation domain-containing protein